MSAGAVGFRCRQDAHNRTSIRSNPTDTNMRVRITGAHIRAGSYTRSIYFSLRAAPRPGSRANCADGSFQSRGDSSDLRHCQLEITYSNDVSNLQRTCFVTTEQLLVDISPVCAAYVGDHHAYCAPK